MIRHALFSVLALLGLWASPLCAALYPPASGPYHAIVEKGQPAAQIVLPAKPSEFQRFAAAELAATIQAMSGAKLPVVQTQKPRGLSIFIGDQAKANGVDWAALGRDGFVMQSVPGGLLLCGNADIGTVYAVYAFLEEHLGCRWFYPHKAGAVLPQAATIRVGRIDSIQTPSYRFRHIGGSTAGNWGLKNRLSEALTVAGKPYSKVWGTAHTFHRLLSIEDLHASHPEYFAEVAGARRGPVERRSHGPQICTSNPEAALLAAENVLRVFRDDPQLEMVTVGPNDGLLFCECTECAALDESQCPWRGASRRSEWRGVLSQRMMHFYNAVAAVVARQAPDKLVKVMFYSWYQDPPSAPGLKLAANTVLMLTHSGNPSAYEAVYPSCYNHPIDAPNCRPNRERFMPALQGWRRRAPVLGVYEYYYKASICHALFPIVHTIRRDVPTYHQLGARYFYTQGAASNAGSYGLNYYVTAKLLWNVNLDAGALLADFYEKFYAGAAAPMREYHELQEKWMAEEGGDVLGWPFYAKVVYAHERTARLRGLLDQADRTAGDPMVKERIRLQGIALRYAEMCGELAAMAERAALELRRHAYWRGMDSTEGARRLAAIQAKQAEMREFMDAHRDDRVIGVSAGNYVKRWLSPGLLSLTPGANARIGKTLQRPEWAKTKGLPPVALPAQCDLWIYANDLDGSASESEHELHLVEPHGDTVKLADFPAKGQSANRRNGLCIVPDLKLRASAKGDVALLVRNKPGHWTGSTLFAFYLMPTSARVPLGKAQRMVERDRDAVRKQAIAFLELPYRGVLNGDARDTAVVLKLR